MRVIAGKYKSRCLRLPPEKYTRPTGGRIRESLFSALVSRVDFNGLRVLDAFAGSGALGLEALSRGAKHATFVEQNAEVHRVLQENVQVMAVPSDYQLVKSSLLSAAVAGPFELILLDPPYYADLYEQTLQHIIQNDWLSKAGLVTVEVAVDVGLVIPSQLEVLLERTYGQTKLLILSNS